MYIMKLCIVTSNNSTLQYPKSFCYLSDRPNYFRLQGIYMCIDRYSDTLATFTAEQEAAWTLLLCILFSLYAIGEF